MPADPVPSVEEIVRRVADAFDAVGIEYAVGGSIASSIYGEPRSTNDVDVAIRLHVEQISRLSQALGPDFAVDEQALRDAAHHRRSWNIYYLPLMLKIDLFVRGHSSFDDSEFSRKRPISLTPGARPIQLSSPEDNLLWKLKWFRLGGEISDRQWRDVLGIIRVSGKAMDRSYLVRWARQLGVADLLTNALKLEIPGPQKKIQRKVRKRRRKRS